MWDGDLSRGHLNVLALIMSAKSLLPYLQVWSLGHGHLCGAMILSTGSISVENQVSKCAALEYKGITEKKGSPKWFTKQQSYPVQHPGWLLGRVPNNPDSLQWLSTHTNKKFYAVICQVAVDLDLPADKKHAGDQSSCSACSQISKLIINHVCIYAERERCLNVHHYAKP